MLNWLRDNLFAKLLVDGFKSIEKTNWMTQILQICYKQDIVKSVWSKFCDSTIGLLEDAIDEVKQAKEWKK